MKCSRIKSKGKTKNFSWRIDRHLSIDHFRRVLSSVNYRSHLNSFSFIANNELAGQMITIRTVRFEEECHQIVALQQVNLKRNTSQERQITDGYVTVQHTVDVLKKMNAQMPSVVALDQDNRLIGYALAMPATFFPEIASLAYLLDVIHSLSYRGQRLSDYRYYVMGQSCVAFGYRGRAILKRMLEKHRDLYRHQYQLLITSVSDENQRSLRAHKSAGFQTVHVVHDDLTRENWNILLWDWFNVDLLNKQCLSTDQDQHSADSNQHRPLL